jgi:hypothetical protein
MSSQSAIGDPIRGAAAVSLMARNQTSGTDRRPTRVGRKVELATNEAIRVFQRCFETFKGHAWLRRKWSGRLDRQALLEVDESLQIMVDVARQQCDEALQDALAFLKVHGIHQLPRAQAKQFRAEVIVATALAGTYLELIELFDQTIAALDALEAMKLGSSSETGRQRAHLRRAVRAPTKASRAADLELRKLFQPGCADASQGRGAESRGVDEAAEGHPEA